MADLQALKTELVEKLAAMEQAQELTAAPQSEYNLALAKWEEDNDDLIQARQKANDAAKAYKECFQDARKRITGELAEHFENHPEDKSEVDAFAFRLEKEPDWSFTSDQARVEAILRMGATFLLAVNDNAVSQFVKNNAVKVDDEYQMPPHMFHWLDGLGVRSVYKPTISDKKLQD